MSSKVQISNLAMGRLGSYGSLENIDTPKKDEEFVFAKWWDYARRIALKELIPNFARDRRALASDATAPAFGYGTRFQYPSDCVKVLGFGQERYKTNTYAIEGQYILTDDYEEDTDGNISLHLRFIKDVTDISQWTPEFIDAFTWFLAYTTNMEITQDMEKQVYLEKIINMKKAASAAVNSQENMPIRINNSKFKQSRTHYNPQNSEKK